jgi:thymidine phosphorylase
MSHDTIKIDGRQFHGVTQELSAAQDDFLIGQLRLAGALELLLAAQKNPEEQKAEALLTQILVSGRAPQILAGVLTEEGKKWTHEEATRNADVFANITNGEDKQAMRMSIVGFVVGFFQYATAFAKTSQKSSPLN